MDNKKEPQSSQKIDSNAVNDEETVSDQSKIVEIGGYKGPEPTRYGDWEQRCTDF